MKRGTLVPLAASVTLTTADWRSLCLDQYPFEARMLFRKDIRVQALSYGVPRCGDWFISGDKPEGYRAVSDLHTARRYWCGQLVLTVTEKVTRVVITIVRCSEFPAK